MTNLYTETYDLSHSHYGGRIYLSDFDTRYSTDLSTIAARIASDMKWERSLKNGNYKPKYNFKRKEKVSNG